MRMRSVVHVARKGDESLSLRRKKTWNIRFRCADDIKIDIRKTKLDVA
jgi:hypothetical protein